MDRLSKEQRSRLMSKVRGKDTLPEKIVRSYLHNKGFRFRLHDRKLPGTPDIVLKKHNTVVFVHGCFWHQHPGCKNASIPQTRVEFWKEKFKKNVENFKKQKAKLEIDAWKVLVVWECEIKKREQLLLLSELIIRKNL